MTICPPLISVFIAANYTTPTRHAIKRTSDCEHCKTDDDIVYLGKRNEDRTRCNGTRTVRFRMLWRRGYAGKGCEFSTMQEVQRTFNVGSWSSFHTSRKAA